jgi:OmpA-OmpF porin, OOP family
MGPLKSHFYSLSPSLSSEPVCHFCQYAFLGEFLNISAVLVFCLRAEPRESKKMPSEGKDMCMKRKNVEIATCIVLLCVPLLAYGVTNGEKVKTKGLITGRNSDSLTLRTADSGNLVVVLTDNTKVVQPKGVLKLRKEDMGMTALIPGLKIEVDGVGDDQNRVVAMTIKFSKGDLQTAEAIQAGLSPTQQQVQANSQDISANKQGIQANQQDVAANKVQIASNRETIDANEEAVNKRFSDLSDYDTKGTVTVYFSSGSISISAKDKDALQQLGRDAGGLKGYLVEVKGFADSSGNAAMNQKLSMERAQGVVAYLIQNCNVSVRHIVAPGAMGEADPAATNETSQGRSENRRVEVKILVNKGLNGA